ncbi:MAG TPA: fibronectin type III domain-containing protein [Planctomycetota bacterium]
MNTTRLASLLLFGGFLWSFGCSHGHGSTPSVVIPATPTDVQAEAADGSVTLQWAPASNAASYCIYYAAAAGVSPTNWSSLPEGHRLLPADSPHVVTGLTNGTTYTFVVTAWNATGDRESPPSAAVQATPTAATNPGFTTPVTMPAVAITSTGATLAGHFTNPNGYTTSAWFEYGPTTAYGTGTPPQWFAAATPIDVTAALTTLQQRATYHYRFVTQNTGGTFAGADRSLTTLAEPQILLGDLDAPAGLGFDGTYVYCFEVYGGRLRRVHAGTGAATTLATVGGVGNTGVVAVFGGTVWFATSAAVYRIGTDGSGLGTFAPLADTSAILANASGVYVRHGQVLTWMNHAGNQSATLYVRTPQSSEGFGGGLAADATHVYWTDYFAGTVEKLAFAGGPKVVLALGLDQPDDLCLDGAALWFGTAGGLRRVPAAGGEVTPVCTATGSFRAVGSVIWVASPTDLFTVDAATGSVTLFANGTNHARYGPVVAGNRIVWLRSGSQYYPPLGALLWIEAP